MKEKITPPALAIASLIFLALTCSGAEEMRYRKAGGRFYDLQPIFDWRRLRQAQYEGKTQDTKLRPRPMPEWAGPDWFMAGEVNPATPIAHFPSYVSSDMLETNTPGFLLESKDSFPKRRVFLMNCTSKPKANGNDIPDFYAIAIGTFKYHDLGGNLRQVPLYDCGVPFDPAAIAAEYARTNKPVKAP